MNANEISHAVGTGTTYVVERLRGKRVKAHMRNGVHVREHFRNYRVIDTETVHNLVPIEGLNHIVGVVVKQATQVPAWYIGLFEGNYAPVPGDTAATFPTAAVECLTYAPNTRPAFAAGPIAGGAADNTANRAEFTFTAAKMVYGAFLAPVATKGGVTGPLLSAARFAEPKAVAVDDVLRVTATFEATSL